MDSLNARRFPYRKSIMIGFGVLSINLLWPIYNTFIPIILQAGNPDYQNQLLQAGRELPSLVGFGLSPSLAFFIMTWDNIINLFVQPWAGAKSDKTWNRFGRRKPWILVGLPIASVAFLLIPIAKTILTIMVFILLTNFGMALFRSPLVSWLGDLIPSKDRSKANGIINLMAGIGGALALTGGGILLSRYGRSAPFMFGSIGMVIMASIALLSVKEPKNTEVVDFDKSKISLFETIREFLQSEDRSGFKLLIAISIMFMAYEALVTGLSSFAVFTLGINPGEASLYLTLFAAAFIFFAIPSGLIGTQYGRRKTINAGLILLVVLFGAGFLLIQDPFSYVLTLVLAGVGWALININSLPLVYDFGIEQKIGMYTGLYFFATQLAAILGPVLSGVIVDALGDQYRWIWMFSAVFMGLSWFALTQVIERRSVTPQKHSSSTEGKH